MSAPISLLSHTHVGTAPPGYQNEWVKHTVHYHGFSSLSSVRGEFVASPEFKLLGNQWILAMFPGRDEDAAEEGMTSIDLCNMSNKAIEIDFGFSVNDENGKQVAYKQSARLDHFDLVGDADDYRGFDLAKRSKLVRSLVKGTLIIEVHMRLAKPTTSVPPPFIPENPVIEMIQGLFLDEKSSDIVFEVAVLDQ